jgi:hypothetical protein
MIADLAPRTSGTLIEAEYRALDAGLERFGLPAEHAWNHRRLG